MCLQLIYWLHSILAIALDAYTFQWSLEQLILTLNLCRLGLAIPEEAIEQMKSRVVVTDEDLQVVAKEEKIRRHDVMGSSSKCLRSVRHVSTLKTCLLAPNYVLLLLKFSRRSYTNTKKHTFTLLVRPLQLQLVLFIGLQLRPMSQITQT